MRHCVKLISLAVLLYGRTCNTGKSGSGCSASSHQGAPTMTPGQAELGSRNEIMLRQTGCKHLIYYKAVPKRDGRNYNLPGRAKLPNSPFSAVLLLYLGYSIACQNTDSASDQELCVFLCRRRSTTGRRLQRCSALHSAWRPARAAQPRRTRCLPPPIGALRRAATPVPLPLAARRQGSETSLRWPVMVRPLLRPQFRH